MPKRSLVIAVVLAALLHGGVALVRIPASRPHFLSEEKPLALSIVSEYKKVSGVTVHETKKEERETRDDRNRVTTTKEVKKRADTPPEGRKALPPPQSEPARIFESPPPLLRERDAGTQAKKRVTAPPIPCYKNNPLPKYPVLARRRGYEGEVLISAMISASGTVVALNVKESSGHPILDRAAVKAVAAWEFEPARRMGAPVPLSVDIPVRFVLQRP